MTEGLTIKLECLKKLCNFWKEIKKRRFDLLLDFSLGREYAFLHWLIGIKERRDFDYKSRRGRFFTHKIRLEGFNNRPGAEYYMDVVGLKAQGRTVLATTDSNRHYMDNFLKEQGIKEQDMLVGIAPGRGASYGKEKSHYKRWPCKNFAIVADKVALHEARPVLLGGPKEQGLIKEVALKMQQRLTIGPKAKIREVVYLIKRCKALVCNNGGLLHIAVSQDTPAVSIFGSTDEKVYGPYPASERHIVITNDVGCRPCVTGVSEDIVFNAIPKLI